MKSIACLSNTSSLYGKINNNPSKVKSQLVWYEKDKPLQIDVADSLNLLPGTGKEILEHMVRKLSQYDIGCFSQGTVARETGKSRKTVNKYVKIFDSLGLIVKQKRYKQTCLYKFSEHIFYEEVINLLTSVIGAFSELKERWVTGIRNLYYISTEYLCSAINFNETIGVACFNKIKETAQSGTPSNLFVKKAAITSKLKETARYETADFDPWDVFLLTRDYITHDIAINECIFNQRRDL